MNLEEEVSRLVRQAVQAFIQQREQPKSVAQRKSVLVIQTDEDYAEEVHRFMIGLADHCQPTLAYCGERPWPGQLGNGASEDYRIIHLKHGDRSSWDGVVSESDLIVFPVVRMGSLVRIVGLLDDEPAVGTLVRAVMSGKETAISGSFVWPAGTDKLSVPSALQDVVSSHFQQLAKYGIRIAPFRKLGALVKAMNAAERRSKRPLVHARHVRDWADEGETKITLPPGSVVTALAKEEAKRLGLEWSAARDGKEE
jgi:hypothetical protein